MINYLLASLMFRAIFHDCMFVISIHCCFGICVCQVDELLKRRESVQSSFTMIKLPADGSGCGSSKVPGGEFRAESPTEDGRDKSAKKKWFNLSFKG